MDKNKATKSKIAVFNSIISNPKMARVLQDAMDAPIGSTKRAKAKSILSIVQKTNPNKVYLGKNDGKGGVSPFSQVNATSPFPQMQGPLVTPAKTTAPKEKQSNLFSDAWSQLKYMGQGLSDWAMIPPTSTVVLPKVPDFKTVSASFQPTPVKDIGTQFADSISAFKKPETITNTEQAANYFAGKPLNAPKQSTDAETATMTQQNLIDTGYATAADFASEKGVIGPKTQAAIEKKKQKLVASNKVEQSNISNPDATKTKEVIVPKKTETIVTNPDGSQTKKTTTQEDTPAGTDKTGSTKETISFGSSTSTTGGKNADNTTSAGSTVGSASGAISLADQKAYAKYYIENNLGSKMYAVDMAKALLGDQGEKDKELIDTLTKEYNLSALLADKNKYADAAPGAKQDLTDYIKGRDEFVKKINGLQDAANDRAATMDMTDPKNKAMMDTYKQYLNILKGRQNQQYGAYLTKDIAQLKADIDRTDTAYQNATSMYQKAYNNQSGINKDTYTETKQVLEDLYNTMEGSEAKIISLNNAKYTAYKNQQELAGITIDKTPWIDDTNKPAIKNTILDENGLLKPGINLNGTIDLISGQGNNYDVNVPIYVTSQGMKNELKGETDVKALKTKTDDYLKQITETFISRVKDQDTYNYVGMPLMDMAKEVISSSQPTLNSYIASNSSNITKALQSLDKNWNYYKANKDAWIDANKKVDYEVLNDIYDTVYTKKIAPGNEEYSILDNMNVMSKTNPTMAAESSSIRLANYLTPKIISNKQEGWVNGINSL